MPNALALLTKYWKPVVAVLAVLLAIGAVRRAAVAEERARVALGQLTQARQITTALLDTVGQQRVELSVTRARVDTVWRRSVVYVARADSFAHRADSLIAAVPPASDTARVCRPILDAYEARTSECAALRMANVVKDTAIALGQAQLERSLRFTETLQDSLRRQRALLTDVAKPYTCRILFLACPSRGGVALATAAILESLHLVLTRKP